MTRTNSITTQPLLLTQNSMQMAVHVVRLCLFLLVLCSLLCSSLSPVPTVQAQGACISLTTPGSVYSEDFNTLSNIAGSTTNNLTLPGWYLTESGGGARDNEQYAVDTGGSTTGDTYSYGVTGNTERALGGLRSGTLIPIFGACFTNNTGSTITGLEVGYTGEEWRLGTAARTDQINFEYSTTATSLTTGTWTGVPALNFVTPDTVTVGAKNGNAAGDRATLSSPLTSLAVANGSTFWIRWTDTEAAGADDGLSVDDFSLTFGEAPTFTNANNTFFIVGSAVSFTVTTNGYPVPTITRAGTLPAGVTLTDNGNGTATFAGIPAAGTSGVYTLTFTASNGVLPNATQNFTLSIHEAPAITSADNTAFTIGTAGSFTVTTTGYPVPAIARAGALPSGVTFTDNGNGTATLAGTPAAGTNGIYNLTFTASNGNLPNATQDFSLTVNQAPAFTNANNTFFTIGYPGTFTVTTTGYPIPAITRAGALPAGLNFVDNGNSTATLSGTPLGTGGVYTLTFTASNGVLPNATQNFTLTVNEVPAITSTTSVTFTVGAAGSFTVTTSGYPAPGITRGGAALPPGVNFIDNGNGTATLNGTPAAGTNGSYNLTFTASNGILPNATQNFTLTVDQAPAITSPNNVTFVSGNLSSFTITTTGAPAPTISLSSGTLPLGITFTNNGNGTATLSGTPALGSVGTYNLTITASNGVAANATQNFTLTIDGPPGVARIDSSANTGDGQVVENEHTSVAITQLLVVFNKAMNADTPVDLDDALNVGNYSLIQNGSTVIAIDPTVTYAAQTATLGVNGGIPLPNGRYTLTVEGDIEDTLGVPIGTDFVRVFYIDNAAPTLTSVVTVQGDAALTNGATLNVRFSSINITFNEDLNNGGGGAAVDDVTNPLNYLLLQAGLNGAYDTANCQAFATNDNAPLGDDIRIPTGTVTYANNGGTGPFVATVPFNGNTALPNGAYRVLICGTTSIIDLAGNALNNGVDSQVDFTVLVLDSVKGNPKTGFAPGVVTILPEQPAEKAYTDLGSLWIEIPNLKLKTSITGVSLEAGGWDVTWLNRQVGWLEGTAYPTREGNTVLTAHGYTADGEAGPFALLQYLKYGDALILHLGSMKYTYAIRANLLIKPNDTRLLTRHEKLDWVTLITCQQYDDKTQSYRYRRVVRAVLISVEQE